MLCIVDTLDDPLVRAAVGGEPGVRVRVRAKFRVRVRLRVGLRLRLRLRLRLQAANLGCGLASG